MTERESYGSGQCSMCGYLVEWRLKPESIVLKVALGFDGLSERWDRAAYSINKLCRWSSTDIARVVQPCIGEYETELAQHELVSEPVAEAVLACLKTSTKPRLLDHIEWRIVCIRLETTYNKKLETSDD